jgi:hypothetical protein
VLSLGAGLIHASVMLSHFREWWLFGLFFALVTPLQVLFAYLVTRPGVSREILWIGAVGNLAIPLVWLLSRTSGLPLGPDPWEAEAVHLPDVVATLDELTVFVLLMVMLRPRGAVPRAPRWAMAAAWTLGCLSLVGAMLGPGTH